MSDRKHLRVAIGPFTCEGGDDWPIRGGHVLLDQGYQIEPFGPDESPPEVDVVVWWSPEYHPPVKGFGDYRSFKVAFLGDWHVTVPPLGDFDLVATDWRGVRDVGRGDPRFLWFRGFSYDPRLHFVDENATIDGPEVDVAFCGRDAPGRAQLLSRASLWCLNTGHTFECLMAPYERGVEAQVYRRAKLVLGHSQRGELQMRAYEAMACGALYVCQDGTDEVAVADAPIPTYSPDHLEDFLGAWLAGTVQAEEDLSYFVRKQREWVARETPVRHLGWLLDRVRERMEARDAGDGGGLAGAGVAPAPVRLVGPARRRGGEVVVAPPAAEPPLNEQRRECADLVPPDARSVLDLGCGDGGFGWWLKHVRTANSTPTPRVTGIDLNPSQLARARLDAFHKVDLDDTSQGTLRFVLRHTIPRPGYDCVTALDVLEHLRDPGWLLQQVYGLLRPRGTLVVSVPNLRNAGVIYELLHLGRFVYGRGDQGPVLNIRNIDHLRFFGRADILELLQERGYVIDRVDATRMAVEPPLDRWINDTSYLLAAYGDDAEAWKAAAGVVQWLVVCHRPPGDDDAE